jgi:type IV secretion system protein VirB9
VITSRSTGGGASDPAAFNFNYKIKGTKSIRPTHVFDDGLFTFFEFADPNHRDLPAIFWISSDGLESLVNFRIEGRYVVVERLSDEFVLRSGDDKATVTRKPSAEILDAAAAPY